MHESGELSLLCRVGNLLCAWPLEHVEETMRPLSTEPLAGVPAFVLGLAVVRGTAVPVVDLATLLGRSGADTVSSRFVTVKVGARRVAVAVDAVVGVSRISPRSLEQLPPLFQGPDLDAVSAIGTLDTGLLVVLATARLVPDDIWARVQAATP
jgi:purine-binding chemotaxis protein CheW